MKTPFNCMKYIKVKPMHVTWGRTNGSRHHSSTKKRNHCLKKWGWRTHQASNRGLKSVDFLHQSRLNRAQQPVKQRERRGYLSYGCPKRKLRQSDIRASRRKWNCGCLFGEKKRNKRREEKKNQLWELPTEARGRLMMKQFLNWIWDSELLPSPTRSC